MAALLSDAITKATRLTQEGRVKEAVAVLKDVAVGSRPASWSSLTEPSTQKPPMWTSPTGPATKLSQTLRQALDKVLPIRPPSGLQGTAAPATRNGVAEPVAGGQFQAHVYAGEGGRGTYKLYVPSHYTGQPLPLVVMLHGCTQNPDDFAAGTRMNEVAEEQGFLVCYPAQVASANSSKCWNWFREADQHRDRGEPALIAGMTRAVMRDVAVDPSRVYVAGLSAGGAAAAIMGHAYPDLYAAVGVHSGLACGAARDVSSAFGAMRNGASDAQLGLGVGRTIPTIVFHGDRDTTVSPLNGDQVIAQSRAGSATHAAVERGQAPAGASFTRTVHSDTAGHALLEQWVLHGAGHAWSGGNAAGTYTDPRGPDASREMVRFFREHPLGTA